MEQRESLSLDSFLLEVTEATSVSMSSGIPLMRLDDIEKFMVKKSIAQTGGNRGQATKLVGIDASTLWRKINRCDVF